MRYTKRALYNRAHSVVQSVWTETPKRRRRRKKMKIQEERKRKMQKKDSREG